MSNLKGKEVKRVFDSIEEINETYGVDLKLPEEVPEQVNLACYSIEDFYNVKFLTFYKEDESGLYFHNSETKTYHKSNDNLEKELLEDFISYGLKYIYLRLAQKDTKDKFTPERLLGVETTKGFISEVNRNITGFVDIGYATFDFRELQYYPSDSSDETVSFDEYVKLFYDVEGDI